MMEQIISLSYSHTKAGPSKISGSGNYELSVFAPPNCGIMGSDEKEMLRMYFLDSHSDYIRQDQVAYYRQLSSNHSDKSVPALMFFHIPIPEYKLFQTKKELNGSQNEDVSTTTINTGLFDAMKQSQ